MTPDFSAWERANLEKLAAELLAANQELRAQNKAVLAAWRAAITEKDKAK